MGVGGRCFFIIKTIPRKKQTLLTGYHLPWTRACVLVIGGLCFPLVKQYWEKVMVMVVFSMGITVLKDVCPRKYREAKEPWY
jgi:hypothetical protein